MKVTVQVIVFLCLTILLQLFQPQAHAAPGAYLFQWGAPHILSSPHGVAIDNSGTAYVADTGNDVVRVFDGSGYLVKRSAAPPSA